MSQNRIQNTLKILHATYRRLILNIVERPSQTIRIKNNTWITLSK